MRKQENKIEIKNKKAEYQFFLLSQLDAGIVLTGTEIKSIREGKANISDAYCTFIKNELFITNMHITEYTFGTYSNHNPKRNRKLLLNKRELRKFQTQVNEKGLTIIPVVLFINEKGFFTFNNFAFIKFCFSKTARRRSLKRPRFCNVNGIARRSFA